MSKTFHFSAPTGATATVIAMMNQKGGVGKSTITTLLANVFFFQYGLKVAIIDADYPQYTILKRRKNAMQYIQSNTAIQAHFKTLFADRQPISVYPATGPKVPELIQQIEASYDLIFVDLAGTINQQGMGPLFQVIHHFFIPVLQDDDTLRSSVEFYQLLQVAARHLQLRPSAHLFFNKVPHQNIIHRYKAQLSEQFQILNHYMPAYTAYERELRSTLFPIQQSDLKFQKAVQRLFDFAKELASLIQLNDQLGTSKIIAPQNVSIQSSRARAS